MAGRNGIIASFPNMMLGISGARGIVDDGLTPSVAARLSAAFARICHDGDIIIARDSRVSGDALVNSAAAGVCSAGNDSLYAGILTTPGTQILVEETGAAGGIMVTASHNPPEWNGLKFIGSDGAFLGLEAVNEVYRDAALSTNTEITWDAWKTMRSLSGGNAVHLRKVIDSGMVDLDAVRRRRYTVVIDTNRGAAGPVFRRLGHVLDLNVIILGEETTGFFIHGAEPIPEHLSSLSDVVRSSHADFGAAVDPDGDRLVFCLSDGRILSEEATLPLVAEAVLADTEGPVVTNLSTSSMIESVGDRHNIPVHRTAVGEAHVVSAMREHAAVFGGEGNGGVIVPRIHYGRDAVVGLALVLSYLSVSGNTLADTWDSIPRRFMKKAKLPRGSESLDQVFRAFVKSFAHTEVNKTDGIRLSTENEWIHVRPSNTEPVLRIVVEAPDEIRLQEIMNQAHEIIGASHD